MSHAKQMAEQYVELFAAEVYNAHEADRPIDEKMWKNIVNFVARGIQAKEDSRVK